MRASLRSTIGSWAPFRRFAAAARPPPPPSCLAAAIELGDGDRPFGAQTLKMIRSLARGRSPSPPCSRSPPSGRPRLSTFIFPSSRPPSSETPQSRPRLAPGKWPQEQSDLKADPAIRFGVLPNGMRYAIRRQAVPAGQASVRLWFDAGSLGRDRRPAGPRPLPRAHGLQRLQGGAGRRHGQDAGAAGAGLRRRHQRLHRFDETVYKLDLPRTDDETVDTALMLLRETAGNLTLDPAAVDRERGVVLSEERASDNPSTRVFKANLEFQLLGQRMPTRYPIGKVDILQHAPGVADLRLLSPLLPAGARRPRGRRRFRPRRHGGQDPRSLRRLEGRRPRRRRSRSRQGPAAQDRGPARRRAWHAPQPAAHLGATAGPQPRHRGQAARTAHPPVGVHRPQPPPPGARPLAQAAVHRRRRLHERTGQVREVTTLSVPAEADRWREALAAIDQEQRRLVEYGVRQDELDREIEEARAA